MPCPSIVGSIVGDIVASQSRCSLPTVTDLTISSGSDAITDLGRCSVNVPSNSHHRAATDAVDVEKVPLVVPVDQVKVKRLKEKAKAANFFEISHKKGLVQSQKAVWMKAIGFYRKNYAASALDETFAAGPENL